MKVTSQILSLTPQPCPPSPLPPPASVPLMPQAALAGAMNRIRELEQLAALPTIVRSVLFVAVVVACDVAGASCPARSCFAITFETLGCKAENDVNNRYPGARLTVKPLELKEVACDPDARLRNDAPPAAATEYYYQVWSGDPCRAFGKPVTLFIPDRCCDTIPLTDSCTIKERVLQDLPPWAQ